MKKFFLMMLVAVMLVPNAGFANVLNQQGEVDSTLSHVGSTDWNTGKGRHDAVVRWATDDNYFVKATGMLGRGFSNLTGGWTELFIQPVNWSKNSPIVLGQVEGLVMGATMGTLRTLSGALDVATFWVPFWYGAPMGKPAIGLNDVHEFEVITDAEAYDQSTKRYMFGDGIDN